ncbi:MAG: PQQ-binding-like beta-propeller repeat protein, partial [Planctomycetota bacterium]
MQMSISKPTGWQDDVVVAAGRSVIVMGSDSDEIFALDRRTGEVLWDSPRNSNRDAEYYLGMSGSRLYVGAYDLVRCYDSIGGRVIWEAEIEGSAGTGIATNEAIYVPTQSSIVKLSLAEGTELARSHFKTMTREPVGNLYSDGNRLFGVGAARTYAFADLQERLSDLEERVTEGEAEATLERARFLCFQGKPDAAWEDLRAAYRLLKEPSNASAFRALTSEALKRKKLTAIELACDVVLQLLDELGLPSSTPKETLAQLLEMRSDLASSDSKAVSKNLVLRCDSCLARSLASIHFSERDGLAQLVISVAKFCDRNHLNKRARQAIETTSSARDLELLRDALKSDHASTREIAVAGLANLGKVGVEVLTSYLKQDVADSLQLEIAIALLNADESYGLVALGELLKTDDVDLRSNALSALVAVTGREKDDDLGEKEIADWQQWIESNYGSAKLTLPYVPLPEPRGRTLVCYLN